jgi:hypothetical protein
MNLRRREFGALVLGAAGSADFARTAVAQADPLPSWNEGLAKEAILKFVSSARPPLQARASFRPRSGSPNSIRTARCGSNIVFCLDRVGALVKEKPKLKDREPFKAMFSGSPEAIAKLSMRE